MTRRLSVDEAVEALVAGGVVALPTDTVYGVAASISRPEAVARLFALKQRPTTVALPVVAASPAALHDLVTEWPDGADRLSRALWPGALTIVVGASARLCEVVASASTRVGFRVPDDPLLVSVLERTGPLALTSANTHGHAPCASAGEVDAAFTDGGLLDGVLDAGPRGGTVSTVVEFIGEEWTLRRAGAISAETVRSAVGASPEDSGHVQ